MPEMPHAGEHHRDAMLVGGRDHFLVAHRCRRAGSRLLRPLRPARRCRRGTGRRHRMATTEPRRVRPAFCALMLAMRVLSTRLIWPAPTPSVWPFLQNTMALDFTYFATRQANSRSCSCSLVGCALVTTLSCAACTFSASGVCTSRPPLTRLKSNWLCALDSGTVSTRTFCFAAVTLSAASGRMAR